MQKCIYAYMHICIYACMHLDKILKKSTKSPKNLVHFFEKKLDLKKKILGEKTQQNLYKKLRKKLKKPFIKIRKKS